MGIDCVPCPEPNRSLISVNYENWLLWVEWYLANGFDITPVVKGGKRPLRKNWPNIHTSLDEFKHNYKECNLGLKTTGLTVVDIDKPSLLKEAIKSYGRTNRICQTGSQGYHLYYRGESGGNRIRINGVEIDIRSGSGGYAVVAPSFTTAPYRWLRLGEPAPWKSSSHGEATARACQPISQSTQKSQETIPTNLNPGEKRRRARAYIATIESIAGQGGDNQLFRAACTLVQRFELPQEEALEELLIWNEQGNAQPPWSCDRLIYKVNQAWRLKHGQY